MNLIDWLYLMRESFNQSVLNNVREGFRAFNKHDHVQTLWMGVQRVITAFWWCIGQVSPYTWMSFLYVCFGIFSIILVAESDAQSGLSLITDNKSTGYILASLIAFFGLIIARTEHIISLTVGGLLAIVYAVILSVGVARGIIDLRGSLGIIYLVTCVGTTLSASHQLVRNIELEKLATRQSAEISANNKTIERLQAALKKANNNTESRS